MSRFRVRPGKVQSDIGDAYHFQGKIDTCREKFVMIIYCAAWVLLRMGSPKPDLVPDLRPLAAEPFELVIDDAPVHVIARVQRRAHRHRCCSTAQAARGSNNSDGEERLAWTGRCRKHAYKHTTCTIVYKLTWHFGSRLRTQREHRPHPSSPRTSRPK